MRVTDDGDKLIIDTRVPSKKSCEAPLLDPHAKPFEESGKGPCVACGLHDMLDARTKMERHCWRAWRFGSRY